MRISDWSSDVCSSDLFAVIFAGYLAGRVRVLDEGAVRGLNRFVFTFAMPPMLFRLMAGTDVTSLGQGRFLLGYFSAELLVFLLGARSEEHTSELQSLMRISYAVFCLKKKKKTTCNRHYLA